MVVRAADANGTTVHALTEGLLLQGRDVLDAGAGDQQLTIGVIRDKSAAGGVLIAHDSLQGIEIITLLDAHGATITADTGLESLDQLIEAGNFVPASEKGEVLVASR